MNTIIQIRNNMKARPIRDKLDRSELAECYRLALKIAGVKNIDPKDVSLDVTLTEQILKREFPSMTMKEVRYATEQGAGGFYGEFHGINPKTFMDWIRAYRNSTEWKQAKNQKEPQRKELPRPKELTPAQKKDIWDDAKKRYLETHSLQGGVWLYGIGLELGYIDAQDELFIEKVRYKTEKKLKARIEALKQQRLIQRQAVKEYQAILETETDQRKKYPKWVAECKREAVKLTFQQ